MAFGQNRVSVTNSWGVAPGCSENRITITEQTSELNIPIFIIYGAAPGMSDYGEIGLWPNEDGDTGLRPNGDRAAAESCNFMKRQRRQMFYPSLALQASTGQLKIAGLLAAHSHAQEHEN